MGLTGTQGQQNYQIQRMLHPNLGGILRLRLILQRLVIDAFLHCVVYIWGSFNTAATSKVKSATGHSASQNLGADHGYRDHIPPDTMPLAIGILICPAQRKQLEHPPDRLLNQGVVERLHSIQRVGIRIARLAEERFHRAGREHNSGVSGDRLTHHPA
jgi:hypothetical protein